MSGWDESAAVYGFPLCVQFPYVEDPGDDAFLQALEVMKENHCYGVEMNLTDFSDEAVQKVCSLLKRYDLRLTMIATGAYAVREGLHMSAPDEALRSRTENELEKIISAAESVGAGVICGIIKGDAHGDREVCTKQMICTLNGLCEKGMTERVPVYLEATNHYEALLVNTVSQGIDISEKTGGFIKVLPDTYHLNIEEDKSPASILAAHHRHFENIHISDNNRYLPGFGCLDFGAVLKTLHDISYTGTITMEGRHHGNYAADIDAASKYLSGVAGAELF